MNIELDFDDDDADLDDNYEEDNPEFIGPRLPPIRYVNFRSKFDQIKILNDTHLDDRVASIFGLVVVDDPLNWFFGKESPSDRYNRVTQRGKSFNLVPADFLRHARKKSPKNPIATVSGFSQWIYSLYSSSFGSDDDRERGLALEYEIIERRRSAAGSANNAYLHKIGSDWKLIHSGLHTDSKHNVDYLNIPDLRVNGEEFRASPDLIYKNDKLSEVIVVELKYSRMEIPRNLWPNVWGQLWCYSQLEIARSANKVTVVGEVWGESWYQKKGGHRAADVCLRASVRRNPRAPAYDRFFRTLFDIYCGRNTYV